MKPFLPPKFTIYPPKHSQIYKNYLKQQMSQNKENKQPESEKKIHSHKDIDKNICFRCLKKDH